MQTIDIIIVFHKNEHFSNIEELKDKAKDNAASRLQRRKAQEISRINDSYASKNSEINNGYTRINQYGNNSSNQNQNIDIEAPAIIHQNRPE